MRKLMQSLLLLALPCLTLAQEVIQRIELEAGWNSVYLEVEPSEKECQKIFADMPIKSVWAWAKQFNTKSAKKSDWLIYNSTLSHLSELHQLQGGKGYLIEVKGEEPIVWNVKGTPVQPSKQWALDTFNLTGFHVDANRPPTFANHFAATPSLLNNEVLRMDTEGNWRPIANLEKEKIEKGTAYWVKADKKSTFKAPIQLKTAIANRLDFGKNLMQQSLLIDNPSPFDKQVTIQANEKEMEGVALTYWDALARTWRNLSNISLKIPAESEIALTVGVDRRKMTAGEYALYKSTLEVNDGEGTQLFLNVSSNGLNDRAGLWVGYASIDKVSDVNGIDDTPQAAASEFQLRLIVHVDDAGNAKLLDQVTEMWQDGTYKNDPEDSTKLIVDEAGKFVLITDDALLDQFSGSTIRDGKSVGRRISSAFFSFDEPILMQGEFEHELTLDSLAMGYDDPLNPFKHKYHPDHNNLDERFENQLREGIESYTIKRSINLLFTDDDPEGLTLTGYGDDMLGGVYKETIQGVHRDQIKVEGKFRLQKASSISRLNEAPPSQTTTIISNDPEIDNLKRKVADDVEMRRPISTLSIHPNPVIDEMNWTGLPNGNYDYVVRDMYGKVVLSGKIETGAALSTANLLAGMYTIELHNETQRAIQKFIKVSL